MRTQPPEPRGAKVSRVERQDKRTVLEIGRGDDYYVIAPKDATVEVGDNIIYTEYGPGFGWYTMTCPKKTINDIPQNSCLTN